MIAWLFWPSVVVLAYCGYVWVIATFWTEAAIEIISIGDMEKR